MSETDLQRAILEALSLLPGVMPIRVNSGSPIRRFRGAKKGTADIVGIVEPGRFFALEVKAGRRSVCSPEQLAFLELVRKLGGIAQVVRSVDEAIAAIKQGERQR